MSTMKGMQASVKVMWCFSNCSAFIYLFPIHHKFITKGPWVFFYELLTFKFITEKKNWLDRLYIVKGL